MSALLSCINDAGLTTSVGAVYYSPADHGKFPVFLEDQSYMKHISCFALIQLTSGDTINKLYRYGYWVLCWRPERLGNQDHGIRFNEEGE